MTLAMMAILVAQPVIVPDGFPQAMRRTDGKICFELYQTKSMTPTQPRGWIPRPYRYKNEEKTKLDRFRFNPDPFG